MQEQEKMRIKNILKVIGISKDSHVIIYDDKNGANAAARNWWMLKAFGLNNVQVLNGRLQAAEQEDLEFHPAKKSLRLKLLQIKIGFFHFQPWKMLKMN